MSDIGYSASCPVCGYEHDFPTKKAMDTAWRRWHRAILDNIVASRRVAYDALHEGHR